MPYTLNSLAETSLEGRQLQLCNATGLALDYQSQSYCITQLQMSVWIIMALFSSQRLSLNKCS